MENITKHILLTLLLGFSLLCKETNAQPVIDNAPWCPPGATWIYEQFAQTTRAYTKFTYEKDTVLNNINAKKLRVTGIQYVGIALWEGRTISNMGYEFLAESNDSIFWYDKITEKFNFLYFFNPQVGDTFIVGNSRIRCLTDSTFPTFDTLYVTSTETRVYENRLYNSYNTSSDRNLFLGPVLSKIGGLVKPFPDVHYPQCSYISSWSYVQLICYSDSIRGSISFSTQSFLGLTQCHMIATSISDIPLQGKQDNAYLLYPNPANSMLNIVSIGNRQIQQISIYNTSGSLVFERNDIDIQNPNIDVAHLSKGLYVVKIEDSESKNSVFKFLKQ
ncbi:MAG TPA: T9SS type A sorting domain-containing protein [Chitinophagales bacterium]|nr:T9SS type A sorting domain-containing protein [Chitinophagales bacterium]HRP38583.1 T9SS type A sorting domain-containing protein [Chitinophagales bacterium]